MMKNNWQGRRIKFLSSLDLVVEEFKSLSESRSDSNYLPPPLDEIPRKKTNAECKKKEQRAEIESEENLKHM